jgi:hypothetical protein
MALPPVQVDEIARLLQHQLRIFWMSIFLVPVAESGDDTITLQGSTWLELFLLCTIRGGRVVRQQVPGESTVLPKLNRLFKNFLRALKSSPAVRHAA